MSARLDPKLNAYREDLAAASLRGTVAAPRYVEGERRQVVQASAPVRSAPRFDAPMDTEALFGETVTVFDEQEGWAWVQLERDRYVGYLPVDALSGVGAPATHRVWALRTYVFTAADIKSAPLMLLSLNARVSVGKAGNRLAALAGGGFVPVAHLQPLDAVEPDFVSVAERFVGTPYLWGGRTSLGTDCSGLVQLAMEAAGRSCPRDTYMQEASLGEALPLTKDLSGLQRGDLVFWPGHVGIMVDERRVVHDNAHHMATTIEPLAVVAARNPDPIRTVRRP